MKKIISTLLSVAMLVVMCIPALATNDVLNALEQQEFESLEAVAYMDLNAASVETRAQIIMAREEIIYSQSWVADGVSGCVRDEDGNIIEELSQFSEIFPSDWDMPSSLSKVTTINSNIIVPMRSEAVSYDINPFFNDSVWLSKPPANTNSPSFCSFVTTGFEGTAYEYNITTIYTSGIYQNPSVTAKYNIGYSNATTGASLGWKSDISNGNTFEIDPPRGITVAVRASSSNNVGDWTMRVDGKRVNVN